MQSSALPSDHRPQPRPSRPPFRTPVNLPPRLVPANSSHSELRRTAPSWLPPPPPPPLEAHSYEDGRSSKRKINDRLLQEDFESRDSDCIGALDGSHFRVKVGNDIVQRYRGRKAFPTQNVLAACSFDLKFTYVLPGWEGSASDSRILDNALTRDLDKLIVPQGKYYLVDAGYQLRSGFLAPYRSTRYHLKEYSLRQPKNARELFNLRHASLRNAIERVFGILKKRFPILGSGAEPYYHVNTQSNIVIAGCILHNYLMGIDPNEELIAEVDEELMREPISSDVAVSSQTQQCREGEILRERIATTFWRDYNTNND